MYVNLSMRSQGVGAVGHHKSDSLKKSTSVEKLGGGGEGRVTHYILEAKTGKTRLRTTSQQRFTA